jgi:HPt (histidine-containing phosphotransfer) domain-containing protein
MVNRTRFEVVPPPMSSASPAPEPSRGIGAILAGLVVLASIAGLAWAADHQLRQFLAALDEQALGQAGASLEQLLAQQRGQLVAEVKVLADDNRIRATVLAPKFDEATVQDILEDLRKSSGATLLAVVDATGKVTAVAGAAGLREVNLSSSPAVKAGFDHPASAIWTLPDQVQIVGLAPIRSGDQTPALLVKGLPLGRSQLATVGGSLGVIGALFIGERAAAGSSDAPELDEAVRAAGRMGDGTETLSAGGRSYLARLSRTGDGATAARLAWLVPQQHQFERARPLLLLIWCVVPLGALMYLILIVNTRRRNGGNP